MDNRDLLQQLFNDMDALKSETTQLRKEADEAKRERDESNRRIRQLESSQQALRNELCAERARNAILTEENRRLKEQVLQLQLGQGGPADARQLGVPEKSLANAHREGEVDTHEECSELASSLMLPGALSVGAGAMLVAGAAVGVAKIVVVSSVAIIACGATGGALLAIPVIVGLSLLVRRYVKRRRENKKPTNPPEFMACAA